MAADIYVMSETEKKPTQRMHIQTDVDDSCSTVATAILDSIPTVTASIPPCVDLESRRTEPEEYNVFKASAISGLYTGITMVIGFVLILATVLSSHLKRGTIFLQVFNIYMYGTSVVFLLVAYGVQSFSQHRTRKILKLQEEFRSRRFTDEETDSDSTTQPDKKTPGKQTLSSSSEQVFCWTGWSYEVSGVNFFLRLGAISLGTIVLMQDGFLAAEFVEHGIKSIRCQGILYVITLMLHVVFVVLQTFFIFKHHKLAFQRCQSVIRIGLMHLVATNVCIWLAVTVNESRLDYVEQSAAAAEAQSHNGCSHEEPEPEISDPRQAVCLSIKSLSRQTSPFLYPFAATYCFTSIVILCRIFANVGHRAFVTLPEDELNPPPSPGRSSRATDGHVISLSAGTSCHKANRGLFLGLLVLAVTVVAVSCYFISDVARTLRQSLPSEEEAQSELTQDASNDDPYAGDSDKNFYDEDDYNDNVVDADSLKTAPSKIRDLSTEIFYGSELILLTLLWAGTCKAFYDFRLLRFVTSWSVFDEGLPPAFTSASAVGRPINGGGVGSVRLCVDLVPLAIGAFGMFGMQCFTLMSVVEQSGFNIDIIVAGVTAIFNVVQAAAQTMFIIDASYRWTDSKRLLDRKPGRAAVTFLIIANLSMWVLGLFDTRKSESKAILIYFYGRLLYTIVSHLLVPLVIFFRFYSAVCLSQIWINSYRLLLIDRRR